MSLGAPLMHIRSRFVSCFIDVTPPISLEQHCLPMQQQPKPQFCFASPTLCGLHSELRHCSSHEVRCAATKQKKRLAGKKASKGGKSQGQGQGPTFEDMMLLWDDVFGKFCEESDKVMVLKSVGEEGLEMYGRGCVLVHVSGRILPRGAGMGFLSKSRPSNSRSVDPPPYEILQWTAGYVPREAILNPMKAAADTIDSSHLSMPMQVPNETKAKQVPLIAPNMLLGVLRGMDRTRLLGLTRNSGETANGKPTSTIEQGFDTEAAGGEKPYEPKDEEMVVMLAVDFGGSPLVGADVVQALLDTQDSGDRWSWKLRLRDFENL